MFQSLRWKILALQFLSILLTVVLLGTGSYLILVRALTHFQQEMLERVAFEKSREIERHLEDIRELMLRIDLAGYSRYHRDVPLARHFSRFARVLPELSYLNLEGKEEVKVRRGSMVFDFEDRSALPVVRRALTEPNLVFFSDFSDPSNIGEPVIHAAVCRRGYFGDEFQGVLFATIPLSIFKERFLQDSFGEKGFFILAGEEGRPLFNSDRESSHRPLPDKMSPKEMGQIPIFGQPAFVATSLVSDLAIAVVAVVPREEFMAAPHRLRILTVIVCLLVLAAMVPLAARLSSNLVKRLRLLMTHTDKVAVGRLEERLEIRSGDEVETLARAFNSMTDSLRRTRAARDSLDRILQSIMDPLLVTDGEGKIVQANAAAEAFFGIGEKELAEKSFCEFIGEDEDALCNALKMEARISFETTLLTPKGEVVPALISCCRIEGPGGLVALIKDITERKRVEAKIEKLAYYDSLTGLPNRILFSDRLEQSIVRARRTGDRLAVLFLDLDNFKQINDNFGHDAGDRVLKEVADTLRTCIRECDSLGRLAGDEFVLVLEDVRTPADAAVPAQKILTSLSEALRRAGVEGLGGASIGISLYPQDGDSREILLKHADLAMYQAKGKRNSFCFFKSPRHLPAQEHEFREANLPK